MPSLLIRAVHFSTQWRAFGLRGAFDIVRGRKSQDEFFSVRVAACQRPLWVRRESTDPNVLEQGVGFRSGFLPRAFVPRVVLDLGANIGVPASVFAARWPSAKVLAVEPESNNFELLQRNCSAAANITAVQGAVWSCDGELEILNPEADAYSFIVGEPAAAERPSNKIPGFSIPSLMQRYGLDNLDLVKMDIEGAEKDIFAANAAQWLPYVRVLIVELHDRFRPGCSEALDAAVAGLPHQRFKQGEYEVLHFEHAAPERSHLRHN